MTTTLRKRDALAEVAQRYAVAITPAMEAAINPDDPHDPIAAQFVPDVRELEQAPHESPDPIGDHAHSPVKGIVHRYPDRALLKIVHACPVYCRFCFRREMVGPDGEGGLSADELDAALGYVSAHDQIWEVILTGGDPFILSPRRVRDLMLRLNAIGHVKVVRWHTRVPLVDPGRVTEDFVRALRVSNKAVWVALHANHSREFTDEGRLAIARLVDHGIAMVSQTVLLAGVNDDPATLEALMRRFVENRIKPYYLHHLDAAPGVEHFRRSIADGQALMRALHANASGLCQPSYVLDIPGGVCKARLGPCDAQAQANGWLITDDRGSVHDYDL